MGITGIRHLAELFPMSCHCQVVERSLRRCSAGLKLDWESRICEVVSYSLRSLCVTRDYAEHHPTPVIGQGILPRARPEKLPMESYCKTLPEPSSWVPHDLNLNSPFWDTEKLSWIGKSLPGNKKVKFGIRLNDIEHWRPPTNLFHQFFLSPLWEFFPGSRLTNTERTRKDTHDLFNLFFTWG